MSRILDRLPAAELPAAVAANLLEFTRFRARSPRLELHDAPDLTWLSARLPVPYANQVCRARLEREDADRRITAIRERFGARGLPMSWIVGPADRPADLGRRLLAQGFRHHGDTPGMAARIAGLDLTPTLPAGAAIERIPDAATLETCVAPMRDGFGLSEDTARLFLDVLADVGFDADSPLHCYLIRLDGAPAAIATLFLGAGVAGIHGVTTVPAARRRGLAAAIVRAALRDAFDLGYRIAVLRSTPMAVKLYRRLGFQVHGHFSDYVRTDPWA